MKALRDLVGSNRWEIAATLFPVAMDGIHWLVFDPVNDWFRGLLERPSTASLAGLFAVYIAYLVAIVLIGRLESDIRLKTVVLESYDKERRRTTRTKTTWPQILFFYPSVGFGMAFLVVVWNALGVGEEVSPYSDDVQMYVSFAMALLIMAHIVIVAIDYRPRHRSDQPGYFAVLVPTVLISELALNLSTAFWYHFFASDEPCPDEPRGLAMVAIFPLFLLCFAAPRFTFMSKHFTWLSVLSALALIFYEVWETFDEICFW